MLSSPPILYPKDLRVHQAQTPRATVFFLCSRPWALVQKRVSVGVMLCGTINMSVHQHAMPWWFPWTIGVPCALVDWWIGGLVDGVAGEVFSGSWKLGVKLRDVSVGTFFRLSRVQIKLLPEPQFISILLKVEVQIPPSL